MTAPSMFDDCTDPACRAIDYGAPDHRCETKDGAPVDLGAGKRCWRVMSDDEYRAAIEALAEPLRLGMKAIEEKKRRIEAAELRVEKARKWFNESSHPLAERKLGDAEHELRLLLGTKAKP